MLAVFAKAIGKPPEELRLPAMGSNNSRPQKKLYRNFNLCGQILQFTTFHMGILWLCLMKMKVQYTPGRYKVYLKWLSIKKESSSTISSK